MSNTIQGVFLFAGVGLLFVAPVVAAILGVIWVGYNIAMDEAFDNLTDDDPFEDE